MTSELDDMAARAARRAIFAIDRSYELGQPIFAIDRSYESLGQLQRIMIAFTAVAQAGKTLDRELPLDKQEAVLIEAAQAALAHAIGR